ncbi:uncharacterized protein NPIL_133121 [Nephila pilipes]|uniref:Uncharacterized protein n=1 Tax=Nephila pilipes TaxID=299642 RepID=A0A8X6PMP0_NEPPI|nr:uncharacterized protein NPIL_133121 [Nephila pilipes]
MKTFLLLVVALPCIVVAEIRCPGGVICPSSQKCCKVNGQYECCDLDVDIPKREENLYAGVAMEPQLGPSYYNTSDGVTQNGYYGECSYLNCDGTCCAIDKCCPLRSATCCPNDRCCPFRNTCCNNGCCGTSQKCCGDGCCPELGTCCEDGCCSEGHRCCNGWCCKKPKRCGSRHFTCVNAAEAFTPALTSLLMLVAASFGSRLYFL